MDSIFDEARDQGLVEDLPNGDMRVNWPALKEQMPMLHDLMLEAHLKELDDILGSLHNKGLLDFKGVDENGDIVYEVTGADFVVES